MDARITIFIEENGAEYVAKFEGVSEVYVYGVGDTVQEAVKDLFSMAEDARAEFTADLNNGVLGEHLKCELDILNELLGE